MQQAHHSSTQRAVLGAAILFGLAMVFGQALGALFAPIEHLALGDNDDILRFMRIQDWMAGQGWYDGRQYQMLAPAGLDLHWSRFVDLAIVALALPLSVFAPFDTALGWAIVLWPPLLFAVLLCLTAWGVSRSFGPLVAVFAVVAVILWAPTGRGYFLPTRIDHHNVQILLTSLVVATLILPKPGLRWGVIGGIAAGLSLAVGLELLLTLALAGVVLALQAAFREQDAAWHFFGYCGAMAVSATVFFALQTEPQTWFRAQCDVLSVPYLTAAWVGAGVSGLLLLLCPRLAQGGARLAAIVALAVLGFAAVAPLVLGCLEGPYGALPEDTRSVIFHSIVEARPALAALGEGNEAAFVFLIPAFAATCLGSVIWINRLRTGQGTPVETNRLGILLAFAWLGLFASLSQVRLLMMGAGAYPILIGVVLSSVFASWRHRRSSLKTLGLVATTALTLFAPMLLHLAPRPATAAAQDLVRGPDACRSPEILQHLTTLPPARIFASANMSAPMMLLTDHIALTGPYHRSPEAMADGVLAFERDALSLRAALERTEADYLLLCRDARYGRGLGAASALASGDEIAGFKTVMDLGEQLILIELVHP